MSIKIYFGTPGAGKTTHAAMICHKATKHNIPVYSNFFVENAYEIDPFEDCGVYNITDGILLLDEAGIFANNRKFANKSKNTGVPQTFIEFLKLYRHFNIKDIYVYSQAPDDMDITIRRLATEFYLLKKSIILPFSYTRRISRIIGKIDPITHQITDGYEYVPFSKRYFFRPRYYKMFDSWSAPLLPKKEFKRYLGKRTVDRSTNSENNGPTAEAEEQSPTRQTQLEDQTKEPDQINNPPSEPAKQVFYF